MIRNIRRALFALPLMAASFAGSAMGATASQAEIPFEFRVGSVEMPAGRYKIEPQSHPMTVVLTNIDTGRQVQFQRQVGAEGNVRTLVFKQGSHATVLVGLR